MSSPPRLRRRPTARDGQGPTDRTPGQLIFQPLTTANVKKGKIVRGGMFFIWDSAGQSGFVVSEALQAFAPISAPSQSPA